MKEIKGERTRKVIIEKAIQIFSEKGFYATTFQDISSQLSIGRTAVLHHFKNKYDLYSACLHQVLHTFSKRLQESFQAADTPAERLEKNFIANLELAEKHTRDFQLIIFLYYTATHDPEFKKIYTSLLNQVRERYLEIILGGVREKQFNLKTTPQNCAQLIHELLLGSMINFMASNNDANERNHLIEKWRAGIKALTGAKVFYDQYLP